MKLLDKQTITTLKGTERKGEIDEAVKLAKKIDLLRETSSSEETKLAQFRAESLARVKTDIDRLITEKTTLSSEISSLQAERTRLMIPLDKEWDKLNEKQKELQNLEKKMQDKELFVETLSKSLQITSETLKVEEARISDLKKDTTKKLAEVDSYNKEAEKLLKDTESQTQIILKAFQTRQDALGRKESDVEYREVDIKNQLAQIETEKRGIIEEKIRLRDREQTLEREIIRNNKRQS